MVVPAFCRAIRCGMWLTRFQDRSSVSTKTKFGRERSAAAVAVARGGFWCATGEEVQPTAATTATRRPITARTDFPVIVPSRLNPGHRSHRFLEPTDLH